MESTVAENDRGSQIVEKNPLTREASLPLSDIRVLDFTRVIAGPFATALLADLGADVVKIESERGDDSRHFAPNVRGEGALFMLLNRGKRSVVLNLKAPQAGTLVHDMIGCCDVVVENFRPGVAAKLGIDYTTLARLNPGLVYASISGFGQTGSRATSPAYDHVAQAVSGFMSINGWPDGPPTRAGESLADVAAGLYAVCGILAALHERSLTGAGQYVDVAMVDSMFSLLVTALSTYLFTGTVPGRCGNANPVSAPLDSYPTKDGRHIIIAVANDPLFARLCEVMECPHLPADPRFCSDASRKTNEDALRSAIEAWTCQRTAEEAIRCLTASGVPAAPILTVGEAAESARTAGRTVVTEVAHSKLGTIPMIRQPMLFSAHPDMGAGSPPILGEHTAEVLSEYLGYDSERIASLRMLGVIS